MTATASSPTAPASMAALRLNKIRKLIPLEWVAVLHGVDRDFLLELAEQGEFWTFNLATRTEGRRKLHVTRSFAETFERDRIPPRGNLQSEIALALPPLGIAPAAKVTVRATELARRWCLDADSINVLIRAGELQQIGTHSPANESPRVSYTSAAEFLERRAL
jgi:hypothetical protein